jgi:hypothetical protein
MPQNSANAAPVQAIVVRGRRGLFLRHESKSNLDSCTTKYSFHPLSQYLEIQFVAAFPVSRGRPAIPQHVFDRVLTSTDAALI